MKTTKKLGDFKEEILEIAKLKYSKKYVRSQELSLRLLIGILGEDILLSEIDRQKAEYAILRMKVTAPRGFEVYYRTLRAIFSYAVSWGYIDENPFSQLNIPKPQQEYPAFLYEDELHLILEKEPNDVLASIYATAFYTGLRLSEVTLLQWSNIDFNDGEHGMINVGSNGQTTKSRKPRTVPLNIKARNIMDNMLRKEQIPWVFPKKDSTPYTPDYVSKRFKKKVREAGLSEAIHFHSLRHSFASNLVINGAELPAVQELMGHASIRTTEIYAHLNIKVLIKTVALLDAI